MASYIGYNAIYGGYCMQLLIYFLVFFVSFGTIFGQGSQPITLNDFSQLNETIVKDIIYPSSYYQLQDKVIAANNAGHKLSLAGSLHSQGGHAFVRNGIAIHLANLNKIIHLDEEKMVLTVQAGATWHEIQKFLNPRNLSIKIMQFANPFTVGGSLSVNCNGIDPHCGPLIESVRSIKIMLADGSIVTASRSENSELFKLAIGGYGLFGIILECTLDIVKNDLYKRTSKNISLHEYHAEVERIKDDPLIGFHFAHLKFNPRGKKLFSDVMSVTFKKIDENKISNRTKKRAKKLYEERFVKIKQISLPFLRESRFIKSIQWFEEALKDGKIVARNNIMSPPASHFYCPSKKHTQLLQEYFIPVHQLIPFIDELEFITCKLNVNLLHVAFRFIRKNTESVLSYTNQDCLGVVLLISQPMTPSGMESTQIWTRHLITQAIKSGGTYYLPIQLHATQDQLCTVYPKIKNFFQLKKHYDPHIIFMNQFYANYALENLCK